jgi:hypothetical protein
MREERNASDAASTSKSRGQASVSDDVDSSATRRANRATQIAQRRAKQLAGIRERRAAQRARLRN